MDQIVIELSESFPKEWTQYLCDETMSHIGKVDNPATTLVISDNDEDEDEDIIVRVGVELISRNELRSF